ncbi:MAG: permease [Snowella sp.]|nr:permease [Snowella sp.]
MNQLHQAFTIFLSLLVEAIPFLTIGVLLSSAILIFSDEKKLIAALPRHPILGSIMGSIVGFLFPVCECGNVPVARRFLTQGLPTSVAIGFLLAAPTINPIVVWSTWVAFRDQPEIVIFRVIFSLIIAISISCIFSFQPDSRPLLQPLLVKQLNRSLARSSKPELSTDTPALLQSGTFWLDKPGQPIALETLASSVTLPSPLRPQRSQLFFENVLQELRELGGMLVIGSAIAASIQTFVPREIILSLGQGTISSIVAMMILAAVVSVCSTVDSFFALSFASAFTSSSILAFLVFGPMIDLKSIGLMLSIFKPRYMMYLLILAAQLTFTLSLIHSYFF